MNEGSHEMLCAIGSSHRVQALVHFLRDFKNESFFFPVSFMYKKV